MRDCVSHSTKPDHELDYLRKNYLISFQDVALSPARMLLHSFEQLQLYSRLAKEGRLILHIDATGGIIKKSEYTKKTMYLFSAVADAPSEDIPAVSVSDFLTEESTDEHITFWLKKLRNDVARIQHSRLSSQPSSPLVIVTDFSWVLIHAALDVFCHTDIATYLDRTFQRCILRDEKPVEESVIFSCASHFISRAAKAMAKFFTAKEARVRQLLLSCIGLLVCSPDLETSQVIWNTMVRVFGKANEDHAWSGDLKILERLLEGCVDVEHGTRAFTEDECEDELAEVVTSVGRENKPLRQISPYASFFVNPEECSADSDSGDYKPNSLYKLDVLAYIYKVWLPTYGLWGEPALRGVKHVTKYLTNAKVESWFR